MLEEFAASQMLLFSEVLCLFLIDGFIHYLVYVRSLQYDGAFFFLSHMYHGTSGLARMCGDLPSRSLVRATGFFFLIMFRHVASFIRWSNDQHAIIT